MYTPRRRTGLVGAILLFLGAVLLLVALLIGWYAVNVSLHASSGGFSVSGSGAITFNLGNTLQEQYSYSIGGVPFGSLSITNTTTYNQVHLNSTGQLYQAMQYVVLGGILLAFASGVLAVLPSSRPGLRRGALALGIVALLLAVAAPVTVAVAQPGALRHDASGSGGGNLTRNTSGPWNGFFGSCSGASCGAFAGGANGSAFTNTTETWGPGGGWYVSLVGFVILLIGVVFARRKGAAATMPAGPPSSLPYYAPAPPAYGAPSAPPMPGYSGPPPPSPPPAGGPPPYGPS